MNKGYIYTMMGSQLMRGLYLVGSGDQRNKLREHTVDNRLVGTPMDRVYGPCIWYLEGVYSVFRVFSGCLEAC